MKYLIGAAAIGLALSATQAQAQEGFYVAMQGGLNKMTYDSSSQGRSYDIDTGWVGSAAVGYNFPFNMRAEFEGAVSQTGTFDVSKFGPGVTGGLRGKSVRGMFNVYYDIPTGLALRPYVGGGVGLAYVKYNEGVYVSGVPTISVDDGYTAPAYQLAGGLSYNLIDNAFLTLDYRYFITQKGNTTVVTSGTPSEDKGTTYASEFRTGLRFGF